MGASFHRYAVSLVVLFISRFAQSQRLVNLRQTFVRGCHGGDCFCTDSSVHAEPGAGRGQEILQCQFGRLSPSASGCPRERGRRRRVAMGHGSQMDQQRPKKSAETSYGCASAPKWRRERYRAMAAELIVSNKALRIVTALELDNNQTGASQEVSSNSAWLAIERFSSVS